MGIFGSTDRVDVVTVFMCDALVIGAGRDETKNIRMPLERFGAAKLWEVEIGCGTSSRDCFNDSKGIQCASR